MYSTWKWPIFINLPFFYQQMQIQKGKAGQNVIWPRVPAKWCICLTYFVDTIGANSFAIHNFDGSIVEHIQTRLALGAFVYC